MIFSTPEFWVLIAFLLLFLTLGKRAYAYFMQVLDAHAQKAAHQVKEAERLQEEALSLLKTYKKKSDEATLRAEEILAFAEQGIVEFKKSNEQALEHFQAHTEKLFKERLAIEQEEAKAKLRGEIVDEALAIIEQTLLTDEKERKKLTLAVLEKLEPVIMIEEAC